MPTQALERLFTPLGHILSREHENWILWLPVFFGLGIVGYFQLTSEPPLAYGISIMLVTSLVGFYLRFHRLLMCIALIFTLIAAGFTTAQLRSLHVNAPKLSKSTGATQLTGTITSVLQKEHGKRFMLNNLTIENITLDQTPKYIRLNINTNHSGASVGDTITTLAVLNPPGDAVIPGGYNFARYAYFQQIGAVGYAIQDITIIKKTQQSSLMGFIAYLRQKIGERILAATPRRQGHIINALLIGERGGIQQGDLEHMRSAGLAHLLAISGMHLALVASIFFFCTRALLALSESITLRYNIKKWAVFSAISGSCFYLLISGMPISAQRAFIMSSLFMLTILLDRSGTPMRSVALAAMLVLLFQPESILTASFQMSFAAVIALVTAFQAARPFFKAQAGISFIRKCFLYLASVIIASFIAGLATAPFALYHFNQFSSYNVLANLLAVPLTSLVIMPLGVATLLLMPLGLEPASLVLMSKSIQGLLVIAENIATLPHASTLLPTMPNMSLTLIVLAGLWCCIWQQRWRFLAVAPLSVAVVLMFTTTRPDIIIDGQGKLFALQGTDQQFYFSTLKTNRYSREMWLKRFGQKESPTIWQNNTPSFSCDSLSCLYDKGNHHVAIAMHPIALHEDCASSTVLINLTHLPAPCSIPQLIVNRWDLYKRGTHTLSLTENPSLTYNQRVEGTRFWNK